MSGTVLVTASVTDADPGYVGARLVARGFTLRTVRRERGKVPPIVPHGTVAVLLGSGGRSQTRSARVLERREPAGPGPR
jgi:hypothetical protein